jgi:hypothetical protein
VCTHTRSKNASNAASSQCTLGALHSYFNNGFLENDARMPMALLPLIAAVHKLNIVVWRLSSSTAEGELYKIKEYGNMQAVFRGDTSSSAVHHLLHYVDANMSLYDGLVKSVPAVECNDDADA